MSEHRQAYALKLIGYHKIVAAESKLSKKLLNQRVGECLARMFKGVGRFGNWPA